MEANGFRLAAHLKHALILLLAVIAMPVHADDLVADGPLASGLVSDTMVKPNIGFIFDDSASMDEENMPDGDGTNKYKRCWGWYKYNTLFYNPNYTYKPPYKPDGAEYADGVPRFPDAEFTAALKDGYFPKDGYTYGGDSDSNTTTDLSTSNNLSASLCEGYTWFGQCDSSTKYYYSKRTRNTDENSCGDDGDYQIVTSASNIEAPGVETGSEAAKTNYANWYSYYRNRAMMMKAATAEAFGGIDDGKYRIGLFFLNSQQSGSNGTDNHPNSDLSIAEFSGNEEGAHRVNFFERLYGARSDGNTPLRGALTRMGRMYAGKISGWDPVQYSCQQNFAILSTDGYWNTSYEDGAFGPKKIDGTTDVGNQDGGAVDPSPATATIETDGKFNQGRCYRPASIRVTRSGVVYDLIDPPRYGSCEDDADDFGEWVRNLINRKTGDTGFSASYSSKSDKVTIYAPVEWGDFTGTPTVVFEKVEGRNSESFTISPFGNFVEGSNGVGTPRPYFDSSNAENTLADIAYYYYKTDLRTEGLNNCTNTIGDLTYSGLCENNVKGNGKDTAANQHMTTFTIGLGVSGSIEYESNYETARNVDNKTQYADILAGSAEWPAPTTDKKKIDDLWHAAVNGRGTYYSAKDATTLRDGIQSALNGIQARRGASAAAATSNLEPVSGDNNVYVAMYQTMKWDGDLVSFSIDPATGGLSNDSDWSAQEELDTQFAAGVGERAIKYFSTAAESGNLKDFTESNLAADELADQFADICAQAEPPAQCEGMSETRLAAANSAENLVNYLRGDKSKEIDANNPEDSQLYRLREHLLGDIVNAVPVYMSKPPFSFDKLDDTYAQFKTANASRAATVFIAANDGMLHAINADNGTERWAFVPTEVMKNMWRLADSGYSDKHRYFVDGSPTIADVCNDLAEDASKCQAAANWKTILVGGLNKGGCGYYALDVTDPANPKGLWEFTDPNMGYTFGNPIIAKNAAGRWVAIVTSGYDNRPGGCKGTGDGQGHVFVLDAYTGEKLADIVTTGSGGGADNPSNLGRLNAWIEDARNPTADRLYGGDLLGNVWRIDFDGNYSHTDAGAPLPKAVLLARLEDDNDNPQPVSTKPELAVVGSTPVVLVGTGRYLGTDDLHDDSQQSLYALKDRLGDTGIADVRGEKMLERTLSETSGQKGSLQGRIIRTLSGATMSWNTYDGWYFDFNPNASSPGERVNVDMTLQYNLLTVAANVPAVSACDVGGYAYLYFVDINTGLHAPSAKESMAGLRLTGNALVAGIKTVKLTDGRTVTIVTDTAGNVTSVDNPDMIGAGGTGARRAAWREIVD